LGVVTADSLVSSGREAAFSFGTEILEYLEGFTWNSALDRPLAKQSLMLIEEFKEKFIWKGEGRTVAEEVESRQPDSLSSESPDRQAPGRLEEVEIRE
jgi:hypothetical protein